MIDYKLIQALAAVVREGGFEKAGKALFITQSAVSQRVKLLEDQIGQVLLVRSTPPLATPTGQKLIKHYLQVKRLEEDLREDMNDDQANEAFTSLAVGVNGDSLATWFLEGIGSFLLAKRVLLDLRVDDQEQTHRMLKSGEVVGCISTRERPLQGCRCVYVGCMRYRMLASFEFAARWFPQGLSQAQLASVPAVMFDHQDALHRQFFLQYLGKEPDPMPVHYLPSSDRFVDFLMAGLAYGMVPDQQSSALLHSGQLVDLAPDCHVPIRLHWHCWNLDSGVLENLTTELVEGAKALLGG